MLDTALGAFFVTASYACLIKLRIIRTAHFIGIAATHTTTTVPYIVPAIARLGTALTAFVGVRG